MRVAAAIEVIRRSGRLSVEGDVIHCRVPTPRPHEVSQALATLRRYKPHALRLLHSQPERECSIPAQRWYPFLHHEVWTPLGAGELLAITSGGIEVRIKGESVSRYFRSREIALAADNFALSSHE